MNIKKKIVLKREIRAKKARERSAVVIVPQKPAVPKKVAVVEQPKPVKEDVKKPNKKKQPKVVEPVIEKKEPVEIPVETPEIVENNEQNIE